MEFLGYRWGDFGHWEKEVRGLWTNYVEIGARAF